MRYVTSAERIGIAKGLQEGIAQGLQEGIEIGKQEGLVIGAKMLSRLLEHRFGALPETILNRVLAADEEQLNHWQSNALEAATLAAVFNDEMSH
ncbi:MAG: transposase [Methylococcaceae bacterium]|nr:transposase [Methylococcaceae bacterium]